MLASLLALAPSTSIISLRHWAETLLCSNAQIILHFTQSKKKKKKERKSKSPNAALPVLVITISNHPLVLGTQSGLPLLLRHTHHLLLTQNLCPDWPFFPECSSLCHMACPVASGIVGLCSDTASQRGFFDVLKKKKVAACLSLLEHSPTSLSGSNFFYSIARNTL